MQVTINVTANDITKGCRMDSQACPVHRAMQRALSKWLKEHKVWFVTYTTVTKFSKGTEFMFDDIATVPHPPEVTAFIRAYDDQEPVEPFKAVMTVPDLGGNTKHE